MKRDSCISTTLNAQTSHPPACRITPSPLSSTTSSPFQSVTSVEGFAGEGMADPSTCYRAVDSLLIPRLPDDLSLRCIARVPRSSHPSLLLVSRSWCSLLRSRRLFALRVELGVTEPSLCVNICTQSGESRWYFLNLGPCRLLPLPPPPFPTFDVGCAVMGSSLYVLGGYCKRAGKPSSAVQVFDPCLNRWTTSPPMAGPRESPVVSAFNGRIYVFDGPPVYIEFDSDPDAWAEVFDPAIGAWASLPRRPAHIQNPFGRSSAVFRGQLILNNGVLLDLEAAQPWGTVPEALMSRWAGPAAVLEGVLYSYNFMGKLVGYDQAAGVWKPVEGVEGELPVYLQSTKLTKLGGQLCLIWTQTIETDGERERRIRCVGVQITRTSCGGFRGSIAWREVVANPISYGSVANSEVLEF